MVVLSWGVIASLACFGGPRAGGRYNGADSIHVEVQNQNFYDTVIFVVYAGSNRRRLGAVGGQSTREFGLRWEPTELRFRVDFVGARLDTQSEPIEPRVGETVRLQILSTSHQTGRLILSRY